jgi:uncharacterized protein YjbJ (UPF0337 family)
MPGETISPGIWRDDQGVKSWRQTVRVPMSPEQIKEGDVMNEKQVSGKVDQVVGKVKQRVGAAVGNQDLANQGVADQVKGAAKETWGDAKDAAKQIHESHKEAAKDKANEERKKVSESVEQAKDKAKDKIEDFRDRHSA